MNVIDFSWARPGAANIKAAGYGGVIRYLSSDTTGKTITLPELESYRAEGLDVGFVWEDYANAALSGETQGVTDAQKALNQANALGVPSNVPIYFAVDFDTTPAQQTQIDAYLKGVASVIGADRVGVYGSFYVMERCSTNGTAKWFWQTLAWSGGQQFSGNHIYQDGNSAFNKGADVDEVKQSNWGQWVASVPGPAPVPNPAPAPTPSPQPLPATYTVVSGDTLSGIGTKLGISWQTIASLNNISSPYTIYPGEVLRIGGTPTPPNGSTYTVVSGDTLSAIGSRLGVSWQSIASLNNIPAPYVIYPGEVLRLPGGNVPTPAPTPVSQWYTIVGGDTLGVIANHFGTSVGQLVAWNQSKYPNMTANFIEAGWVIRVR